MECSICLDDIEEEVAILKCNHFFHKECISEWLSRSNTCPYCRKIVNNKYKVNFFKSKILNFFKINNKNTTEIEITKKGILIPNENNIPINKIKIMFIKRNILHLKVSIDNKFVFRYIESINSMGIFEHLRRIMYGEIV